MEVQEARSDFVNRLLDFHTDNRIPPSQYLSWEFLMKHPEMFANEKLDGVDWDTVPGLFSWVSSLWTMMIDIELAIQMWTFQSPFDDHFVPDRVLAHNLALCLVLLPNTNKDFQVEGGRFKMHVFSAVVIYVPKVQRRCMLLQAIEQLAQLGKNGESRLALVRISWKALYLPCPADEDKINYVVAPVDGDLVKDIGCPEDFAAGHLLCLKGICWIIGWVSNETNEDVCLYTWRIYSSRYLDTLLHKVELNNIGKMLVYIHSQQRIEKCENCS